jgi:hypothetical protein
MATTYVHGTEADKKRIVELLRQASCYVGRKIGMGSVKESDAAMQLSNEID